MMHAYTRPETTIELVRRYLCANPVGAWIETSMRELARIVGRSAGQMSCHVEQLVRDGWIDAASDRDGTLIEVLRSDRDGDSVHDRQKTRSCQQDAADRDHVAARESDDLPHDRANVYRNKHDSCSSSSARESASVFPPGVPVVSHAAWAEMCRGTPGYNAAQFAADFRALLTRGYAEPSAVAVIITARENGEPIYTSNQLSERAQAYRAAVAPDQEATNGAPTRPDTAGGAARPGAADPPQRRRSARPPADSNIPGWVDEFFGWPQHLIPERYRAVAGVQ